MESKEKAPLKKRSVLAKAGRVFAWIIGSLIFLIVLVLLLIQTAPVQNFARKKVVNYLENKLKTKVEIGKLDIKFPTSLSLQNIFIEDQSKDTLLYGGELDVDISMFKLLKGEINIQEIAVDHVVAKIKRLPPDSTFNFQFIVDAFASAPSSSTDKKDTSSAKMNIDRIIINNTRIVYKDAFTGNDMDLAIGHFDTKISTFDPSHLLFEIPSITLKGLKGHFYQLQPLQQPVPNTVAVASAQPENYLQFINKEMNFSDIDIAYKNEPSNINSSFVIGNLVIHPKKFDLKNGVYALDDVTLDKSAIILQTDSHKDSLRTKQLPAKDSSLSPAASAPFKFIAGNIKINESNIKYDDQSAPHIAKGMDFSHLNISDLALDVNNIEYSTDTTFASVKSASFKEQSGFELNNFITDFSMYPTGVSLQNLLIQTPGTEIKKSAVVTYPSLASIQKYPGETGLNIDIQNSKIAVKDILNLAPQLSAQLSSLQSASTLYVDARITGKVNDLNFQKLILKGLTATDINASGTVKGLPDSKKINADLKINKFQTSKKDILSLLPPGTLPANITLPETLTVSGTIKGGLNNLNTNVALNTSLGNAAINGSLINITDSNKAQYDLALNATNLQLGTLMQNPELGSLSGNFKVKGTGYNPETANATFSGYIPNIILNKYNYTNIKADGSIADKTYKINASVNDPNISADVVADGKFSGKFAGIHLKATIDSIRALPLHFSTTTLNYHGDIDADFSSIDPDNLVGNLAVTHSVLVTDSQRIVIDSLGIMASNTNGLHSLKIQSDFLTASIEGKYKLTQLGDVFHQAINPYYSITTIKDTAKVDPYNFSITAGTIDNATLQAFVPALTQLKPVILTGHFSSDSGWNAYIKSPYIVYGTNTIDNVNITAVTKNGSLAFNIGMDHFQNGTSLNVYATTLEGTLQNNNINFTLNIKDKKSVDKYIVSGLLSQRSANNYSFSLKPGNLLLNYNKWIINADNSIQYFNKDIAAHNFILSQGNQELGLNTIGTAVNSPLKIDFKNFEIATIAGFVQNDSLLVNGLLNGNAVVKNIQTQPTFTTDLTVDNLSIYNDTIGNLTAKVNNNISNNYEANIALSGFGNQVSINGNYIVKPLPANSSYNFVVDLASLQMKSLEGFTNGGIKDARGFLSGKISLNGDLKSPNIDGKINFNDVAFNASTVNSVFRVDKEAIAVINNKGIEFNKFTIRDTTNNALVIDGAINTTDFLNYNFNLTIKANHFQAINSTAKDNKVFYGKMVFSTRLSVKGTPEHPVVEGNLSIDDKTDFTIVLPQADPGIQSREGIVRFVDYSAKAEDSVLMAPYDSLKVSPLVGYDVSVNITVSKEAAFNVIVDQANGDFLKLKGTAELTAGIDASGKINMVGSYEIEEGSYDLAFNLIKRKFLIQKGSRIVWTGDPTSAQLDVTAIYIANTAPYDLVQQTSSNTTDATYKQKLPFEVHLLLKGELLKPDITFDVVLPEDKNYNVSKDIIDNVESRLTQMRQEPAEMNKQVFALLLLGRFVGDDPFNSGAGSLSAVSFAKQSVSRLLSEQLNNLTKNLIQGVDINFDLATTQDYTTGSAQDRTDLNVGVSKNLLSDRLTVTVGNDFQLAGPQATNSQQNGISPDITLNYKLSKDGRYALRAYRRNDNTGTIEGYVIETGLGFVITVDYNKFKEIFISKKQRREKRKIRRENKEEKENSSVMKAGESSLNTPEKASGN
ncbi:MAG TPA: translocation/assembly module TamB domain-containing protein [Ginsengibacter sp.]